MYKCLFSYFALAYPQTFISTYKYYSVWEKYQYIPRTFRVIAWVDGRVDKMSIFATENFTVLGRAICKEYA